MDRSEFYTVVELAAVKDCNASTIYNAINREPPELESEQWSLEDGGRQTMIPVAAGNAWHPRPPGRPSGPVLPESERRSILVKTKMNEHEYGRFVRRKRKGETEYAAVRRLCCGGS